MPLPTGTTRGASGLTRSEAAILAWKKRVRKAKPGALDPKIAARVKQILAGKQKKGPKGKAAPKAKVVDPAKAKAKADKVAAAEKAKAERAGKQLGADMRRETAKREREKTKAERVAAAAEKAKAALAKQKQAAGKAKVAAKPAQKPAAAHEDAKPGKDKAAPAANRAKVAKEMADQDSGLSPSGSAALGDFADGKPLANETATQFESMGLTEKGSDGSHRLTSEGRAAAAAMSKGDTRGAMDAISRAKDKKKQGADKTKAKADADTAKTKAKADKDKSASDKETARTGARERLEQARIQAAQSRNRKAMSDIDELVVSLLDVLEELIDDDSAIKAGARHSKMDASHLDEAARHLHSAGATCPDCAPMDEDEELDDEEAEEEGAPLKGIEFYADDLAALPGYAVKATGDGRTSGYLVKFGGDGDLSQWRDVFDQDTDYGRATKSDVWVHHRMLPGVGKRRLTNQAEIGVDDEGVFIKHLLDLRSGYEAKLYGLVQAGKLGWSSGTAPHLVDRKATGDGRHKIEQWPLGLDASYTPTPAGGLVVNAGAMKSLLEDSGIDLLNIIHEASITQVKSIDTDSQEAPQETGDRHDGAKAQADRARKLLLQAQRLRIQE